MNTDFLGSENARNKKNAALYTAILQKAWGHSTAVLCGHHLCLEQDGDLNSENEVPSADTMIFNHDIMSAVFGADKYLPILRTLAAEPVESRDELLELYFTEHMTINEVPSYE